MPTTQVRPHHQPIYDTGHGGLTIIHQLEKFFPDDARLFTAEHDTKGIIVTDDRALVLATRRRYNWWQADGPQQHERIGHRVDAWLSALIDPERRRLNSSMCHQSGGQRLGWRVRRDRINGTPVLCFTPTWVP